jgi:formylglycine-generating enzyme required for sulfatase activity
MIDRPLRVFISYAQESDGHSAWVLALANRLRADGVEAVIDRYVTWLEKGWRWWMSEQIEQADWVLVVCTDEYRQRFDGNDAAAGSGRGVRWESQHITQALYDDKFSNKRFVPVLPPAGDERFIPLPLKDSRSFRLDDQYDDLYRLLTDQPPTPAPQVGKLRPRPPLPVSVSASAQPAAPDRAPPQDIANPYPGLAAFKPEDCRFFFGREKDTARVVERLQQTRFVSVVGGSGTGKSSLVAAGVVPALRGLHAPLTYLRFKPQADPFRQLAETLDRALPEERLPLGKPRVERLSQELDSSPQEVVAKAIAEFGKRQAPLAPVVPVILFADQFEELFTQTPPDTAQRFRVLFEALHSHPSLFLVLTLRSEFMHRLMEWLGGEVFASSLAPLDAIRDETRLREIIVHPATESGVGVQPELLSELLPAAHEMAGALPLLALTLTQLFVRRDPADGLTLAAYQRMGGLPKIVESAAAGIDQAIDDDPLLADACERLFAELATVIDELPTRRTAAVEPLRADAMVSVLVDALRAQGLLADPDERHVELAHETLLKHWPRLREWCARYADKLALRRQAEQAAGDWQKARTRENASGQPEKSRHSDLLRWTWERQKPALQALLALNPQLSAQLSAQPDPDPDFADTGIDAWRALQAVLSEPLRSFLAPEPLRLLDELRADATPHQRREEIGLRLNQMGDPRRGVGVDAAGLPDLVWVDIPAGQVTLETEPPETFAVATFQIAKYPITWCQYRAFVDAADGYHDPRWWNGLEHQGQPGAESWGFASYPAINVSWYDALAFCRWLSKRLGLADEVVRLPAEWEWQWVTQAGAETQEYPWRGEWNRMRANSYESGIGRTTAVGMYPLGAPDCWPLLDLSGNVWEWCLNPYKKPGRAGSKAGVPRVLRGGAWYHDTWNCRAAYRNNNAPDSRLNHFGFRVCRGAPIEPLRAAPLDTGLSKC